MKRGLSRRTFLRSAGAAMALPNIITSSALGGGGRPPASERIVVGGVGIGDRGGIVLGELVFQVGILSVVQCHLNI